MLKSIMFVDDSANVLESFKWIFKDEPYYLFSFDSPFEALSVIGATDFAVVIADRSMKRMDGLEFMKKVKEKSPDTATIVLYAFTESNAAMCALRKDYVYKFVKKPLDSEAIKQAVETAVGYYQANVESRRIRTQCL